MLGRSCRNHLNTGQVSPIAIKSPRWIWAETREPGVKLLSESASELAKMGDAL